MIRLEEDVNNLQPVIEPKEEGFTPPGQTAPREDQTVQEDNGDEDLPVETEVAPEVEEEIEEEVEDDSSHSAKARIREQAETIREQREQLKTLQSQMSQISGEDIFEDQVPNNIFNPQMQPGAEITVDQYKGDVARTAQALVDLRLKQRDNAQRIRNEVVDSITAHPELDDRSDSFDQDLSDSITEAVSAFTRQNPTGSVKGYIEKLMKPYKRSVENAATKQTEARVKQASQAALRPTQVKGTSKKFEDMSIEEMEKKLGKVF